MRLRPPTVADVPALARVHLSSWLEAYRGICADEWMNTLNAQTFEGYHRPRLTATIDRPVVPDPAEPFVVAVDEHDEVIGFARGGPTRATSPTGDPLPADFAGKYDAELFALYVHPMQQRSGVGGALFDAVAAALRERGHRSMCLWVLSENAKARQFYERKGGAAVCNSPITLGAVQYDQTAYAFSLSREGRG